MPYQYITADGTAKAGRDPATIYYETLAAMRLFSPPISNGRALCELLGGAAYLDGTYGMYAWNPTSIAADDGGVTIKVTAITTGRWIRIRT